MGGLCDQIGGFQYRLLDLPDITQSALADKAVGTETHIIIKRPLKTRVI
jgi:hypothetical protein